MSVSSPGGVIVEAHDLAKTIDATGLRVKPEKIERGEAPLLVAKTEPAR